MARILGSITFGKKLRSLEVGGFLFTETYHPPNFVLPRHDHEWANFNFTVRGNCRETTRRLDEECGPYSLVIKPSGEAHSNRYGSQGARSLIVAISGERLETLDRSKALFQRTVYWRRGPLNTIAGRMYAELRTGRCGFELVLEGLALEFLGELSRLGRSSFEPTKPVWLIQAQEKIHASFATQMGLSQLARECDVDPSYFARTFRRWFGYSVGEYIRRIRIQYVAEHLATTDRPLVEIAVAAGFYDQSHLTTTFRLHMGQTPGEYRRAINSIRLKGHPLRSQAGERPAS